ncbi:MAG: PIN domain-containing protein [Actinobacteria bacterium]|nr:PIN domain-containing protein [Actinomycetota bacterium]
MAHVFLDSNVLLRHLLQDVSEQAARATAYLEKVESGEVAARISDAVVMETVFVLERSVRATKREIRELVLPLLELRGLVLPGKRRFRRVFDLYADQNISFVDAYHVVQMKRWGIGDVVSFDRDFDRLVEVRRREP